MTDEEKAKAEEYCKKSKDFVKYTSETYRRRLGKAYLDGLKAGRKESEKEIAELKGKMKGFESGDVAWQGDMDATIKQNLELKAQIEKMKCCGNCKQCVYKITNDGDTRSMCGKLKGDVCFSNNYEDWELSE